MTRSLFVLVMCGAVTGLPACCPTAEGCGELDLSGRWTETNVAGEASTLDIENQEGKSDVVVDWQRHGPYEQEEEALRTVLFPWDRADAQSLITLGRYAWRGNSDNTYSGSGTTTLHVQADRPYPCLPNPGERYCNLHHQLVLHGASGDSTLQGDLVLVRESKQLGSDTKDLVELGRVAVSFTRDSPIEAYEACVCLEQSSPDGGAADAGM